MLVVYLLYRTHHCQAERITMRPFVTGETGFVANNIIAIPLTGNKTGWSCLSGLGSRLGLLISLRSAGPSPSYNSDVEGGRSLIFSVRSIPGRLPSILNT